MNNTTDSTNATQQQAGADDKKIALEQEKQKKRIEALQEQNRQLFRLYQREWFNANLSDRDIFNRLRNKRDVLRHKEDTDCGVLRKNTIDLSGPRNKLLDLAQGPVENCQEAMEQIKVLLAERENLYSAQIGVMKDRIFLLGEQKTLEDELDKQEKEFNDLPNSSGAEAVEKRRAVLAKVRALAESESLVFDFYGFEDGLKEARAFVEQGLLARVYGLKQKLADVPAEQKSPFEDFLNDARLKTWPGENDPLKELERRLLEKNAELYEGSAASASESLNTLEFVLTRPDESSSVEPSHSSDAIFALPFSMEEYPSLIKRRLTRLGLELLWIDIQRVSNAEPRREAELNRLQRYYKALLDDGKAGVERLRARFDKSIRAIDAADQHIASYVGQSVVKTDHPNLMRALNALGLTAMQDKGELTEEDMKLIKEKATTLLSEAQDKKQALHRDEGEMALWHSRLLSTYSEAQLEQWRLDAIKSHIETSTENLQDGFFADRALHRIEGQLNDIVWWKKYQPRKENAYGAIKDQLEKVRDDFDKWKSVHEWMQLELELQQSRREKRQTPQDQLSEKLKELSVKFVEQRAASEASSPDPGNQSVAPAPEWLGRVAPKLGKALANSLELQASLPEEQVEQQLSAIFEKMKAIFKNPGEEGAFDRLQDLQRQARELTSERPWERDIISLSTDVGDIMESDPLRERAFDQYVIMDALYQSTWRKYKLIVYKKCDWLQEKSTLTFNALERVLTAELPLSHMFPKHKELMEYVLELEKPYKWSKGKIKELIDSYMRYMKNESVEAISATEVIHEINEGDRQGAMMSDLSRLSETAHRVGHQLADPFFNAMSEKRTRDRINIDLASLGDNELRRLEDLPPMLKWAAPRLLEAKKKQMVTSKELDRRVSAQIKFVGGELIKWQRETGSLRKAETPLFVLELEETIRAFDEQANALAAPDVAYLRDKQAEQFDCMRRTQGWSALEPALDRVGSWLNFYDSELQRLQKRIKEDNKQAESAPLKVELERRLDRAEDDLRYALEQTDLRDFERVLAAYEFIKSQLISKLRRKLDNFESELKDVEDAVVMTIKTDLRQIREAIEYSAHSNPRQVEDALREAIDNLKKPENQLNAPLKDLLPKMTDELDPFLENWMLMVVTPFNHFKGVWAAGENRQIQQSIDRRIPGALLSRMRGSFKELKQEEKKYEETPADGRERMRSEVCESREAEIRERLLTEARREAAWQAATEEKRNEVQSRLLGDIRTRARKDFRSKDYLSDEDEVRMTDQLDSINDLRREIGLKEVDLPENKKWRVADQLKFLRAGVDSLRETIEPKKGYSSKAEVNRVADRLRVISDSVASLEKTIGEKERYSFDDEEAYVAEQVKASEVRVKNEANNEIDSVEGREAIESIVSEKLRNDESSYRGGGPYERSAVAACEELVRYAEHERRRVQSWESYGYEFPHLKERAEHFQQHAKKSRKEAGKDLLTHVVDHSLPKLDTKLLRLTRATASIDAEVVQSLESEFTAIQLELESDPALPKFETSGAAHKSIELFDRVTELDNKVDGLIFRHQANIQDRMQDIWELVRERAEHEKARKAAENDQDKAEIQKKIKRIEISLNGQLEVLKGWRWGKQDAEIVMKAYGKDKLPELKHPDVAFSKRSLDEEYRSLVKTFESDQQRRRLMAGALPQALTIEKLAQWHGELETMEKKKEALGERIKKLNVQVDVDDDIGTLERATALLKDIWQSHPDLATPPSGSPSAPMAAEEALRSVDWWNVALTKQKEKFQQIPVDIGDETPLNEIKAVLKYFREAMEKQLKDPEFDKAKKNYLTRGNERVEARRQR
ncbi:MAG TPA: hypothetical protein VM532_01785, partial [Burkholderiales bacterium]|nr:hypothetical protein [Burkholderiales bacterium]